MVLNFSSNISSRAFPAEHFQQCTLYALYSVIYGQPTGEKIISLADGDSARGECHIEWTYTKTLSSFLYSPALPMKVKSCLRLLNLLPLFLEAGLEAGAMASQ